MGFEVESEREPIGADEEDELRRFAMDEAATDLSDLDLAKTEIDRFYALTAAARAAASLERYDIARKLSEELLAIAPSYRSNWNYGNAIHHAHTALGIVAIAEGKFEEAKEHLVASGATPGSPQLDTFGPSMELARALMRNGEFATVAKYLNQCRAFWEMGHEWINVWESMVARNVVPNCVMHAFR